MAPSTDKSQYDKLNKWVVSATGTRVQAEVAWLIAPVVPRFIIAGEKATFDCGLLLTEKKMDCLPTERVFEIEADGQLKNKPVVIPLDVKHIGPVLCRSSYRGYYDYRITYSRHQRDAVAFIVKNVAVDDLAAVIPHWYLDQKWPEALPDDNKKRPFYASIDTPLMDENYEVFPPEWGPFVFPETYLPQAMESLTQFALEKGQWKNPYSGVIFAGCPAPRAKTIDSLIPQTISCTDIQEIKAFRSAFQGNFSRYKVDIPCLQPSVGDFYLSEAGGPTFIVELKRNCSRFSSDNAIEYSGISDARKPEGSTKLANLSPLAQWDLLFLLETTNQKSGNRLVVFFRDELPESWFRETPKGQSTTLWHLGRDLLRRRTIIWDGTTKAVSRLEGILDELKADWSPERQRPRQTDSTSASSIAAALSLGVDEEQLAVEAMEGTETKPKRESGEGRKWSPEKYLSRQMKWFDRQCDIHQYGSIYRLGAKHPSGTHIFVPGRRQEARVRPHLHALSPNTPLVFLNFMGLDAMTTRQPQDHERPYQFMNATYGPSPSFYILTGLTKKFDELAQGRYLVPSTTLNSPHIKKYHDKILEQGFAKAANKHFPLYLSRGELLDVYRDEDVVPRLRLVFEQFRHTQTLYMGREGTTAGVDIQLDDYVLNPRTVNEQWLGYFTKAYAHQQERDKDGQVNRAEKADSEGQDVEEPDLEGQYIEGQDLDDIDREESPEE